MTDWCVCGFDEGLAADRKTTGRDPLVLEY